MRLCFKKPADKTYLYRVNKLKCLGHVQECLQECFPLLLNFDRAVDFSCGQYITVLHMKKEIICVVAQNHGLITGGEYCGEIKSMQTAS